MSKLNDTIRSIKASDKLLQPEIQAHLDDLTKPQGSLGRLEEFAMQYCLITGNAQPSLIKKKIFCFAGDHGVAAEGVSAFPQDVTPQMVMNMALGGAAINVLARHADIDLEIIDIGVAASLDEVKGVTHAKVRNGTNNIVSGPAMSIEDATKAIETGIAMADSAAKDNVSIMGTGDMGIANTTPSTALYSAYLNIPVEDITGVGTGIDTKDIAHKVAVIQKALEVNAALLTDPLSIMAAVGGLEIAGICGLVLGAAANHIPIVIDGFISTAGAVAACKMNAAVRDYLFFSHMSHEKGHCAIMKAIDASPILNLNLRLGEGTGAALAISVIEAAVKVYNEMATFSSAGVSEKSE